MADPQAQATFGNIELTSGWDFTVQDGPHPSAFLLRSPPHLSTLQLFGDLVISQNGSQRTFIDCHISDPVFRAGMEGQEWTLPILDRRWKWQGITINGSYNVRQADETLLREKTPHELAQILLDQLGETNINVAFMPNDARPHITWDDSSAVEELDRLCNDLGCLICIDQDGSRLTRIEPIGSGNNLPPGPALGGEDSIAAKPLPSRVNVVADRTIFENVLALQEVALDTDMTYKLPPDLSYTPPRGWQFEVPDVLFGVTGTFTDPLTGELTLKRDLATAHIYRAYRIVGIGESGNWQPWGLGGGPSPSWIDGDILPQKYRDLEVLQNRAGEVVVGDVGSGLEQKEPLPPIVYGDWFEWAKGKITGGIWPWGFSIDTKRGIVNLSQPAFLYDCTTNPSEPIFNFATLKLRTAFYAGRDGVFQKEYFFADVPDALPGAPPLTFHRRELRRRIVKAVSGGGTVLFDNYDDLTAELAVYANNLVDLLTPTECTTVEYQEIRSDIEIDGKTRQITYSGGGMRPGTTTVSNGTPHNPYLKTSDEQRLPRELRDHIRGIYRLGAVDYVLPVPWRVLGQS